MRNVMAIFLEGLAARYKYRPLPLRGGIRDDAYAFYRMDLNGFDGDVPREATIGGTRFCKKYDRIVIGYYGAYLEVSPEDIEVVLSVPPDQAWRQDTAYIESRKLNVKYRWFEYEGCKVYQQLDTVKYADYIPGKFYVGVHEFDRGTPWLSQ